uniref:Neurotensin/neuromedin N n=1 Tax=Sinocyclocheilus anshuiensis TaxID=1608454 RepID=A0A671LMZ1_9TELE
MKLLHSTGGPNDVSLPEMILSCLHSFSNILHRINIHYLSSVHLTVKQSKHISPLWQLPLQDVCRMMNSLGESWPEAWGSEEEVSGTLAQNLEQMHDIRNLCRVLQPRELQDDQEYLELDQNNDSPLKRKSPYILKRQLRTNKSRRPYILKRSVYY